MGKVEGIYSDLLLHDMGQEMADDGSYSDGSDGSDEPLVPIMIGVADGRTARAHGAAGPPRRHSAGVADAAALGLPRLRPLSPRRPGPNPGAGRRHARRPGRGLGAASSSSSRPGERLQVEAFLKSLVAPQPVQLAQRGD